MKGQKEPNKRTLHVRGRRTEIRRIQRCGEDEERKRKRERKRERERNRERERERKKERETSTVKRPIIAGLL